MDLKLLSKGSVLVLSGSNPPDCPIVLVPAKVVQALNLNFDDMNGHVQPRFYIGFTSYHGKPIFYVTFKA